MMNFTEAEKKYLHSVSARGLQSLDNVDLRGISERQYNMILERRAKFLGGLNFNNEVRQEINLGAKVWELVKPTLRFERRPKGSFHNGHAGAAEVKLQLSIL
jgi:hypothetical protein